MRSPPVKMGTKITRLLAVLAALSFVAAACGGDSSTDTASEGSGVSGEIFVSGSSTVEPISVRVAQDFADIEPDVLVDVDGPGTGDGFALFCEGQSDISDASRPIKEE